MQRFQLYSDEISSYFKTSVFLNFFLDLEKEVRPPLYLVPDLWFRGFSLGISICGQCCGDPVDL